MVINPSRCAILRSDSWGTVSPSYLNELKAGHPLKDILQIAKSPFAYPNGIRKAEREEALRTKGAPSHAEAKEILQQRYFDFQHGDPSIPLFAFVGRITSQKGVHLILNAVDELIGHTGGKIQILVGGPANYNDEYSAGCARHMLDLRRRHPWCFWAAPDNFFTDGPMCNLGADFGLMPSLFEPGGIVQQEFFVAGTPVVAYKTGGLRDTVHEWRSEMGEGNGFTFEDYSHGDFVWAVKRALRVFSHPHEYEELRASAYETTVDVSEVAWAWSSEFHRLRNAMYTRGEDVANMISATAGEESELYNPNAAPVLLQWGGGGESIVVKGSFDNWSAEWPLSKDVGESGLFGVRLLLPPGEYYYKFRVDQVWTVAENQPQSRDDAGFVNNVLVV
ncbi:Starch synthase [Gracilaria domingensis]|nr:Starch synthase [Gracilaria domingensis]